MPTIPHSKGRSYAKVERTAYFLPHDEEERKRLILQSNTLLSTYDNKILHAPIELTDSDLVLDAGCGTGVWLQDLARQTTTSPSYVGIDTESALMPDPLTLPPKMKFVTHSVTSLPTQWTGKFTVVHQRFLVLALRKQEWEQALSEFYRIVKPGGWIQLFEMKDCTSGPALAKQLELMRRISDATGTMLRDLIHHLPDFLRRSGFINIREDVRKTPLGTRGGQDGIDGTTNIRGAMEGAKTPILRGGGFGIVSTESEYDESVQRVLKEVEDTPGSAMTWSMFLAQKPFSKL